MQFILAPLLKKSLQTDIEVLDLPANSMLEALMLLEMELSALCSKMEKKLVIALLDEEKNEIEDPLSYSGSKIYIVPVIKAFDSKVMGYVMGAVMIIAGILTIESPTGWLLIVQGIATIVGTALTTIPKASMPGPTETDNITNSPSYNFSNFTNRIGEAYPVPLVYGKVRTSGTIIDYIEDNRFFPQDKVERGSLFVMEKMLPYQLASTIKLYDNSTRTLTMLKGPKYFVDTTGPMTLEKPIKVFSFMPGKGDALTYDPPIKFSFSYSFSDVITYFFGGIVLEAAWDDDISMDLNIDVTISYSYYDYADVLKTENQNITVNGSGVPIVITPTDANPNREMILHSASGEIEILKVKHKDQAGEIKKSYYKVYVRGAKTADAKDLIIDHTVTSYTALLGVAEGPIYDISNIRVGGSKESNPNLESTIDIATSTGNPISALNLEKSGRFWGWDNFGKSISKRNSLPSYDSFASSTNKIFDDFFDSVRYVNVIIPFDLNVKWDGNDFNTWFYEFPTYSASTQLAGTNTTSYPSVVRFGLSFPGGLIHYDNTSGKGEPTEFKFGIRFYKKENDGFTFTPVTPETYNWDIYPDFYSYIHTNGAGENRLNPAETYGPGCSDMLIIKLNAKNKAYLTLLFSILNLQKSLDFKIAAMRVYRITEGHLADNYTVNTCKVYERISSFFEGVNVIYPNTALLGFSIKANSAVNTTLPDISAVVQGKILDYVPTCRPEEDSHMDVFYTNDADIAYAQSLTYKDVVPEHYTDLTNISQFEPRYSTNPALCILDFLLNKRYGLGEFFKPEEIDIPSFIRAMTYCDEPVITNWSSPYTEYIFIRNSVQPAIPTGNFPYLEEGSLWKAVPVVENNTEKLWYSYATKDITGSLIGEWSTPIGLGYTETAGDQLVQFSPTGRALWSYIVSENSYYMRTRNNMGEPWPADSDSARTAIRVVDELKKYKYPRFSCNLVFDMRMPSLTILKHLLSLCRGGIFWVDGKYSLLIDKAEPISAIVNDTSLQNISYSVKAGTSKKNAVSISYNEEAEDYQQYSARVEEDDARVNGIRSIDATMPGITNKFHAHFAAKALLYAEMLNNKSITFTVPMDLLDLSLGSVVRIHTRRFLNELTFSNEITSAVRIGGDEHVVHLTDPIADLYPYKINLRSPILLPKEGTSNIYSYSISALRSTGDLYKALIPLITAEKYLIDSSQDPEVGHHQIYDVETNYVCLYSQSPDLATELKAGDKITIFGSEDAYDDWKIYGIVVNPSNNTLTLTGTNYVDYYQELEGTISNTGYFDLVNTSAANLNAGILNLPYANIQITYDSKFNPFSGKLDIAILISLGFPESILMQIRDITVLGALDGGMFSKIGSFSGTNSYTVFNVSPGSWEIKLGFLDRLGHYYESPKIHVGLEPADLRDNPLFGQSVKDSLVQDYLENPVNYYLKADELGITLAYESMFSFVKTIILTITDLTNPGPDQYQESFTIAHSGNESTTSMTALFANMNQRNGITPIFGKCLPYLKECYKFGVSAKFIDVFNNEYIWNPTREVDFLEPSTVGFPVAAFVVDRSNSSVIVNIVKNSLAYLEYMEHNPFIVGFRYKLTVLNQSVITSIIAPGIYADTFLYDLGPSLELIYGPIATSAQVKVEARAVDKFNRPEFPDENTERNALDTWTVIHPGLSISTIQALIDLGTIGPEIFADLQSLNLIRNSSFEVN